MIIKMMRLSIALILTCSSLHNASPYKQNLLPLPLKMTLEALTMDKAVVLAHKHRPNLESFKYAIKASEYQAKEFLSGYFPQINLRHQVQQSKGKNSPNSNSLFEAHQLVYKFGGPLDLYNVGKKETRVVEFLSDLEKQRVQHEVELAFLDAWLLQQQQAFIKSLYTSTKETFKKAEHQYDVQLLDKKDWLKSSADYAQDVAFIGNYDNDTVIAQRKLEFLLGQRITIALNDARYESEKHHESITQLSWNPQGTISLLPLEEYHAAALKSRPDLAINKQQIEIEHDRIGIARKQNLPWMEAFGQVAHIHRPLDPSGLLIAPTGFHQVGININWNIFDGALSHFQASKFEAAKVKALLETEQTRQRIRLDVEEAYYSLHKALTSLQARDVRLAQVKNDLVLAEQNMQIGNISKVELTAAQTAWEQENISWLRQRVETEKSHRDLLFACGYPIEFIS